MQHKIVAKLFFLTLISFFISACIYNTNDMEPLPTKKSAALYLKMGVRYMEMNMLITAKENLQKSVELDSDNAITHNALGALYERLRQYDLAIEQYQLAIALDPNNSSIINNYGRFLCERSDVKEGIEQLEYALARPLNNRKWFAFTNLGRCELQLGQQKKAEGYFRQALRYKKNYSPALFEMIRISYRRKKYMSARGFIERYLEVSTHTAKTLWYAVQTERSLGNQTLAKKYQEMLFKQFPASKETQQLHID